MNNAVEFTEPANAASANGGSASFRHAGRSAAALSSMCLMLVLAMAVVARPAAADHGEPFGQNFGIARDVEGTAFPGTAAFWAGTCDLATASTSKGGVGTAPSAFAHCIDHGKPYETNDPNPTPPRSTTWEPGFAPKWRLDPVSQAAAHPDATASFWFQRSPDPSFTGSTPLSAITDGDTRTIVVKLPPGLTGNPQAVPRCHSEQLQTVPPKCPPQTQVGVSTITTSGVSGAVSSVFPVWNVEPRDGITAEFMIYASPAGKGQNIAANIPITAKVRSDGDFGVDTMAIDIPGGISMLGQTVTLWGVPFAASHDRYRAPVSYRGHSDPEEGALGGMPEAGLSNGVGQEWQGYEPSWGPIKPFLTNPTECAADSPVTTLEITSWQDPEVVKRVDAPADSPVTGCRKAPFDPVASFVPFSTAADSASGLAADITIPQNNDPPPSKAADPDDATGAPAHWKSDAGLGSAQLDKTVVTLPEGMSVNPSAAAGLEGCTDEQMGVVARGNPYRFSDDEPRCPDGSRIGSAEATTPLLAGSPNLTGDVILGTPKSTNPASGDMFHLFLVLRNTKRGVIAKIHGTAVADPATGRLTATFDNNPRVTVENIKVRLKGGARALFAMPADCGITAFTSELTPWTAAHGGGGPVRALRDEFTVGGACSNAFAPAVDAGMSDGRGRGSGTFSLRVVRPQAQQNLSGITVDLPSGLLASIRGVPLCTDHQATTGACPAASRVGSVDASAGSGDPFWLEEPGTVHLTEGYKGGQFGLAVVVPVEAGPFRGPMALRTMVVRQAIHVDRRDASVTVVSDPLPQIWHGIPLRTREVRVRMDRPGFMRNPSDCSPKQIRATILSAEGARADVANHFQASGCAGLPFEPRIGLRLKGRRQAKTGGHPAVRALVRQQGIGEAGIERAVVRLPKSLALDPDNAQALCEFEDGTKPDLEDHCPKGSIVGRARAVTPLLNEPLVGNVYFVKNVRIDEETGNEIRTLPMIVVALRGQIAINLRGESSTTKSGKLVNTFAAVPDAPISRFNLNIKGGRNGILTVTRTRRSEINLCTARRPIAVAKVDGHNGKRADQRIRVRKPCPKGRPAPVKVCRKRTNNRRALRRCVVKVKRNRAQIRRKIAKRKAAKRNANRRNTGR